MTYPTMTTANGYNVSNGLQVPLQYVNSSAITGGWFMRLFIIVIFLGVSLSSYYAQIRRGRDVNIFSVFAVVGLGCYLMMLMLSMIPNLVSNIDLITGLVLEIIFLGIMFLTERY